MRVVGERMDQLIHVNISKLMVYERNVSHTKSCVPVSYKIFQQVTQCVYFNYVFISNVGFNRNIDRKVSADCQFLKATCKLTCNKIYL